ncbi:hypothetical protein ACFE04_029103 [Oxalis oulophora]
MENLINFNNVGILENNIESSFSSSSSFIVPPLAILPNQLNNYQMPFEFEDNKAERVSKSHSQAEKRRRDRINSQLATLRKLIPKSENMDKAALLGSVIEQVKDLKRKAKDVTQYNTLFPTEVDEVKIDCDQTNGNILIIKASLCCDDRPELFTELIRVINNLKLATIRADIVSVGGRTKSMLVLCNKDEQNDIGCGSLITSLKHSLNVILNRIASSSMAASSCRNRSKRQRFFLPHSDYPN